MMIRKNAVAWVAIFMSTLSLGYNLLPRQPLPALAPTASEELKTARSLSKSFNNVAEYVHESVVQIRAEGRKPQAKTRTNRPQVPQGPNGQPMTPEQMQELFRRFFQDDAPFQLRPNQMQPSPGIGTGSGFVFDDNGHILTNNHVVEDAEKIIVTLHDGDEHIAKLVGRDPQSDIAVIKIEQKSVRPLPMGDSEALKVGELVMAVGSPFGLSSSFTVGIVSATHRNDLGIVGQRGYEDFIQTDAAINPGNSGGPLVDMGGKVVGVNSAIVSGSRGNDGVGFAIPIDMASKLAAKIISKGRVDRAMMGISLGPVTPGLARQFGLDPKVPGALVNDVMPNSPADKAGLKSGDIITRFDNKNVSDWLELRNRVSVSDIGKPYEMAVVRNGEETKTKVVLDSAEKIDPTRSGVGQAEQANPEKPQQAAAESVDSYGLSLQELTADLADKFGYGRDAKGLLVAAVKPGSPAEASGIQEGFLIARVVQNRMPTELSSVKQFAEIAEKADEIAIFVRSPQNTGGRYITLKKEK